MRKQMLIGLLFLAELIQGQELYFKPYVKYNYSLSSQVAPEFFYVNIPFGYLRGYRSVGGTIEQFTLSSGYKYGGTVGYKFNDIIGVEIGLDYFNSKKTIESEEAFSFAGTTDWNLKSINSSPSFTFSKNYNKSVLTGKFGVLIGISWLDNAIYAKTIDCGRSYALSKNLCLGYVMGIEYTYLMMPHFAVSIECGIENYSYVPHSARLIENTVPGATFMKDIVYKDEIRDANCYSDPDQGSFFYDQKNREVRIQEKIKMNSVYCSIGVKYIISIK